jgi:hypothetical protein
MACGNYLSGYGMIEFCFKRSAVKVVVVLFCVLCLVLGAGQKVVMIGADPLSCGWVRR